MATISSTTQRRLETQGFVGCDLPAFAETAPWLRFAVALCTLIGAIGTFLASPLILWSLAPVALWGAATPVHPFDHVYNVFLRRFTKTDPLQKRGAPNRFACGLAFVFLLLAGSAFNEGAMVTGYVIGGILTIVGTLVSTTDICLPSLMYRTVFGFPPHAANRAQKRV